MLRGGRGILAAFAGLAALFAAFGSGLYFDVLAEPQEQREATESARTNSGNAPSPSPERTGIAPPPTGDLSNGTESQAYYDREDLKAQREMATWTRRMGQAAILGVMLSVVGIWLIWRTWDATREAAENSRKTLAAYIAKERAILKIGQVFHRHIAEFSVPDCLNATLKNIGPSPAQIETVHWQILDGPLWPKGLQLLRFSGAVIGGHAEGSSGPLTADPMPRSVKYLAITIEYTTIKEGPFYSHGSFMISYKPMNEFGPEDWRVERALMSGQPQDT